VTRVRASTASPERAPTSQGAKPASTGTSDGKKHEVKIAPNAATPLSLAGARSLFRGSR
jgi:hypothetical protein